FLGDLAGGQSGGTTPDQMINGGGQADVFGKANLFIVPKAVPVELRSGTERVPLAIIGIAPEITDLLEEGTNGEQGITELLSQLSQCPAEALVKQRLQPFHGSFLSRHN